jgi:glycosyltransferase involved in cell wall biosynthesis
MRRTLFVMEYNSVMGQSVSGTVQRSEHLINALARIGMCDVLVMNTQASQSVCIDGLVEWLAGRGEVFVCDTAKESSPIAHRLIRRLFRLTGCSVVENIHVPSRTASQQLRAILREREYDLIVCRYIRSAIRTGVLRQNNVAVAVDLDDDPLELAKSQNREKVVFPAFFSFWIIKRYMQHMLSRCSHVWVIKTSDAENYPQCSISILPNIPVFPSVPVREVDEAGNMVLFVGLLGWQPNADGLSHFIRNVWPQVIAERKDAVLRVVGGGASDELQRLMAGATGVEYLGWQESLMPSYEAATGCICPVYQGGGSKIKILEALAHRRPMVLTQQAYDGVKDVLKSGKDLLVAADDSDFARSILYLLENPREARNLADAGYQIVTSTFSNEAFCIQTSKDVDSVLGTSANRPNAQGSFSTRTSNV